MAFLLPRSGPRILPTVHSNSRCIGCTGYRSAPLSSQNKRLPLLRLRLYSGASPVGAAPAKIPIALISELRKRTQAGVNDCKEALVATGGDIEKAVAWLVEKGRGARLKGDRIAADGKLAVAIDNNEGVIVEVNSETDFVARTDAFQELVDDVTTTILTFSKDLPAGDLPVEQLGQLRFRDATIAEAIQSLSFKLGERLVLRRVRKMVVDRGIVAGYSHYGRVASLVGLRCDNDMDETQRKAMEKVGFQLAVNTVGFTPLYIRKEDIPEEYMEQRKREHTDPKVPFKPEAIVEEVALLEQKLSGGKSARTAIQDLSRRFNTEVAVTGFIRHVLGEGIEKKESDFAKEVQQQMAKHAK